MKQRKIFCITQTNRQTNKQNNKQTKTKQKPYRLESDKVLSFLLKERVSRELQK